ERHHDTPACITIRSARAAVDQDPTAGRSAQGDRVTLPDIQESYGETLAVRKAGEGGEKRGKRKESGGEGDSRRDGPAAARRVPEPPRDSEHGEPERGRPGTCDHDEVPARQRRRPLRHEVEERETQS